MIPNKSLVNVLGVVYVHTKTADGGDLYLTRFAQSFQEHFKIRNWYEKNWFNKHKERLEGTSSVYKVPTREIEGRSLDLVVKNCRVGEDVPINTRTLEQFCNAEFNSPWEEFSLVSEMRDGRYSPVEMRLKTQRPMAIYVPPERMQPWQSGRSKSKINRIRARHPGVDLDILKQYKLIYEWIRGKNLTEIFEHINIEKSELVHHLKIFNNKAVMDLTGKGYIMADMKPEHIIIGEAETKEIEEIGRTCEADAPRKQVSMLYQLINDGDYSVIDYELLSRTPEHEEEVKYSRRYSYLDDQKNRLEPTPMPGHLQGMEVMGVPYIYGHAESTGGHLWVVGRNARLFDYFLPERWRKTPSFRMAEGKEVFYTLTKDNIHLVWKTSRVGELPEKDEDSGTGLIIRRYGINSPFEEFAIAHELSLLGIPTVYARAIYMTGGPKIEPSEDTRRYESHMDLLDPEGNPILQQAHNYITIRGYYNGPDEWVAEQDGQLLVPIDLLKAVKRRIINESRCRDLIDIMRNRLKDAGYDGSCLNANDLLLALDAESKPVRNEDGTLRAIICNFELIWKILDIKQAT